MAAAEMVAAQAGLGQIVLNASNSLRTDVVVMGILVIGLFAALSELGMRRLERALVPWKGKVWRASNPGLRAVADCRAIGNGSDGVGRPAGERRAPTERGCCRRALFDRRFLVHPARDAASIQ
ncbi:hypothetical protein [Methylobacterium sp. J-077]|uniref:hypothetical protein n=1 Tax=Methylobacterium sp. J-077 TaxID=2836656 RepID=UPI001FBB2C47|nr:hypothetical protein [Methylobacterium sp. J-077]MCJ2121649.1 hypothetical protein [Methylobacterium sp. J-077]